MSKQLNSTSKSCARKQKKSTTTSSAGQQFKLTDITVSSKVSRKLGAWHPGFTPVLLMKHRIFGTVLAPDAKHSLIVNWDLLKSNLTGGLEHHHSVQHSTSVRLENPYKVSKMIGIFKHDVCLIPNEMEIS